LGLELGFLLPIAHDTSTLSRESATAATERPRSRRATSK
jgi:hypothetical protein